MSKAIDYKVRKSRRTRSVRLAVHADGTVVVTAPFGFPESVVEKFVEEKWDWVVEKVAFFRGRVKVGYAPIKSSVRDYKKYKEAARKIAVERLEYFNRAYGFTYHRVAIRNQKTRWGSCSKKGNLNFNYKIALLPPDLADYVVVHELCHLKEMNHSKRFWELVGRTTPDYRERRAALRKR